MSLADDDNDDDDGVQDMVDPVSLFHPDHLKVYSCVSQVQFFSVLRCALNYIP